MKSERALRTPGSGREFRLPQERDPPRIQSLPNEVYMLAAVDPWRDGAAEMRFYQTAPPAVLKQRRTGLLAGA